MHYHLKSLSLATATLLLSLTSPLLPLTLKFEPLLVQAGMTQDRKLQEDRLLEQGFQQLQASQYQAAIQSLQEALRIYQQLGNRYWEAIAFNDLGIAYQTIGEYQQAMESYQQALTISHDIGFLAGEGKALSDIGSLLAQQNQPELAIVFYKQSVNAREAIRRNIQGLPWEERESYTKTVADTYRALADLFLKQDRVLEAQRVLDFF